MYNPMYYVSSYYDGAGGLRLTSPIQILTIFARVVIFAVPNRFPISYTLPGQAGLLMGGCI